MQYVQMVIWAFLKAAKSTWKEEVQYEKSADFRSGLFSSSTTLAALLCL